MLLRKYCISAKNQVGSMLRVVQNLRCKSASLKILSKFLAQIHYHVAHSGWIHRRSSAHFWPQLQKIHQQVRGLWISVESCGQEVRTECVPADEQHVSSHDIRFKTGDLHAFCVFEISSKKNTRKTSHSTSGKPQALYFGGMCCRGTLTLRAFNC